MKEVMGLEMEDALGNEGNKGMGRVLVGLKDGDRSNPKGS